MERNPQFSVTRAAPAVAPRSAFEYSIGSIATLGTAIVVFGSPLIMQRPLLLGGIAVVLAGVFPIILALYSAELGRSSFKLAVKKPVGMVGLVTITVQAGQRCPYCHDTLVGSLASEMLTCGACETVLHRECLNELGSCPTHGCKNRRKVRN